MKRQDADQRFHAIFKAYHEIKRPRYRNLNADEWQNHYKQLIELKTFFKDHAVYVHLISSLSQTLKKIESIKTTWSNFSERGLNKAVPPVINNIHKTIQFPVKWKNKQGHDCSMNGYWGARNYMVMDVIGYMFLLKSGGDIIPKDSRYLFADLHAINVRESQLSVTNNIDPNPNINHSIGFKDENFRIFTGFKMNSASIKDLLFQTSETEFCLAYPVKVETIPAKESLYKMNQYSRFFTIAVSNEKTRIDGIVQAREYRIFFNTLLGELFINNLLAKFFNKIDNSFYQLPASAQIFYRRQLLHHNFTVIDHNIDTIADAVGYTDRNKTNLLKTVEDNIFSPLKNAGLIDSWKKTTGLQGEKYHIVRSSINDKDADGSGVGKR
jgi:hypothetical protein